ncbi:hypothetical protein CANCADRAFT_995 [Tortispora caseinolytica NRRL Y-17796]|uniref:Fungal-type protein kinase domain-containing protein n=1 Tax=Tortispora caseinolytica NRRL Y-17796 TaxID=767744 RepID=A0A1E4TL90_9ASCO|nr:hypothetical protein CANCADRAFT_995 [Tortispora caseinolytica NRRL Y-17796]
MEDQLSNAPNRTSVSEENTNSTESTKINYPPSLLYAIPAYIRPQICGLMYSISPNFCDTALSSQPQEVLNAVNTSLRRYTEAVETVMTSEVADPDNPGQFRTVHEKQQKFKWKHSLHIPSGVDGHDTIMWLLELLAPISSNTAYSYATSLEHPIRTETPTSGTPGFEEFFSHCEIFLYPRARYTVSNDSLTENSFVFQWKYILVPGVVVPVTSSESNLEDTKHLALTVLIARVKELWSSQPGRRYVCAFLIVGRFVQFWIFHRAGGIASPMSEYTDNPRDLIMMMTIYCNSSTTSLGYSADVLNMNDKKVLHVDADIGGKFTSFSLNAEPLCVPANLISRGTTIWKAQIQDECTYRFAVKEVWQTDDRVPESIVLEQATKLNIPGIIQCFGYEYMVHNDNFDSTVALETEYDTVGLYRVAFHGTKQLHDLFNVVTNEVITPEGTLLERKLIDHSDTWNIPYRKRHRFRQRMYLAPVGRPLLEFSTLHSLIAGLLSALVAHWELYRRMRCLHRNVSVDNILLDETKLSSTEAGDHTEEEETIEGGAGFLVDMAMTMRIHEDDTVNTVFPNSIDPLEEMSSFLPFEWDRHLMDSTSHLRTGTYEFMAIGVLLGFRHSYRHDLESFFYILLWICLRYDAEPIKEIPLLERNANAPTKKSANSSSEDGSENVSEHKNRFNLQNKINEYFHSQSWPAKKTLISGTTPVHAAPRQNWPKILNEWVLMGYQESAHAKYRRMSGKLEFDQIISEFGKGFNSCAPLKKLVKDLRGILFADMEDSFIYEGKHSDVDHEVLFMRAAVAFSNCLDEL